MNPFKDKVRLYIKLGEKEGAWAHTYVALNCYNPNSSLESQHSHGIPIPFVWDPNKIMLIMIITIIMVVVIIQVRINNNDNNDNKSY